MRNRTGYFLLVIFTVVIGLLSRETRLIPLFVGDILWALMVYFIMRFLWVARPLTTAVLASLAFSYAIEFSQLYKAPWIDHLRRTLFGRLVLGDTFLWGDLVSYTIGITIGVLADVFLFGKKTIF